MSPSQRSGEPRSTAADVGLATQRRSAGRGKLRIIGGRWRRQLLSFPAVPGLRPTPDRVRETVFNWLGFRIVGAHCLDLFAGSGSLGFEAASRDAARVVLVERDGRLVRNLRTQAAVLGASNAEIIHCDGLSWLCQQTQRAAVGSGSAKQTFDVVFLDPPFRSKLLPAACQALTCSGRLRPGSLVYLETADELHPGWLPETWRVARYGKAGRVRYYLVEHGESGAGDSAAHRPDSG